jgi:hypothetical protein
VIFDPVVAKGIGWLGMLGAEKGLSCKEGGPHRLGINADTTHCLVCGRPRPEVRDVKPDKLVVKLHPIKTEIRAAAPIRDAQVRRAGNE